MLCGGNIPIAFIKSYFPPECLSYVQQAHCMPGEEGTWTLFHAYSTSLLKKKTIKNPFERYLIFFFFYSVFLALSVFVVLYLKLGVPSSRRAYGSFVTVCFWGKVNQ